MIWKFNKKLLKKCITHSCTKLSNVLLVARKRHYLINRISGGPTKYLMCSYFGAALWGTSNATRYVYDNITASKELVSVSKPSNLIFITRIIYVIY